MQVGLKGKTVFLSRHRSDAINSPLHMKERVMLVHNRTHEQDDLFLHANSFIHLKKDHDRRDLVIENSTTKMSSHRTRKRVHPLYF
jgi:hypothetical protein